MTKTTNGLPNGPPRGDYNELEPTREVLEDYLSRERAAVYAATTAQDRQKAIANWVKARDALPTTTHRQLEDERAARPALDGRLDPELQSQAMSGTLREIPSLPDPLRRVTISMLAFHCSPSGTTLKDAALWSIFNNMNALPEPSQRARAAEFLLAHAEEGSELKQQAEARLSAVPERPGKIVRRILRSIGFYR